MKLKSFQVCAVFGVLAVVLSSCGTSGDVMNPTISQMDKLDVQWGLPPRQSKGVPRRNNAPQELLNTAPPSNSAPPPSAYNAPAPAPLPQQPAAPASQSAGGVDPSVIKTLR